MIITAPMGDPNASIPTPQPVHYRPMFAAYGKAVEQTSITFLSQAAIENSVPEQLSLQRLVSEVRNCRNISKADMIHNSWQPEVSVDPQTYEVRANGELLTCEPAVELPLAQRYFLF